MTTVLGRFQLLEASKHYWQKLSPQRQQQFRFLHVSTDEVYGSLSATDPEFREETPYAASKAASNHFVPVLDFFVFLLLKK
jgi:dTDP-glucose 4,6-dehydratase